LKVSLDASETRGGNRDYILRYRLDGDRIQSGLLLFEGKSENFFLLMMQPPKRIAEADIPGVFEGKCEGL
jgi:Ca-activated chloride channel family protein